MSRQGVQRDVSGEAPGSSRELAYGRVHYVLKTPKEGTSKGLCVLVHGFSTEAAIYLPLMEQIVKAGYSALALDLYGRGHSDAAPQDIPNNLALFTSCIAELLFAVAEETERQSISDLTLIGYSMGGAIVAEFARRYPSMVKHLIMLAPAGLPVHVPLTARFVHSPMVGTALFHMAARKSMSGHIDRGYYNPAAPQVQEHRQHAHTRLHELFDAHKGFTRSLLSTLRHFEFGELEQTFRVLGSTTMPILIVWGNRDCIVPFANLERMRGMMPSAKTCVISDAGHSDIFGHTDHAAQARDAVIDFITSAPLSPTVPAQ